MMTIAENHIEGWKQKYNQVEGLAAAVDCVKMPTCGVASMNKTHL